MKKTITSNDLKNLVNEAHAQVKDLKGGKNANYIPFLDKIDSNLYPFVSRREKLSRPETRITFSVSNPSPKCTPQF